MSYVVQKKVRAERLELSSLAAPDPKSGTSTNFATPADRIVNYDLWITMMAVLFVNLIFKKARKSIWPCRIFSKSGLKFKKGKSGGFLGGLFALFLLNFKNADWADSTDLR